MTEQVEKTEAQLLQEKLRATFDAGMEAGKSEDDIKLELISAGATFKNVTRLFNEFMVDGGHAASKEERGQQVLVAIEGRDLKTEDGFAGAVAELVKNLAGSNEKSASALIRAHAKKVGLEVFKKAKEGGEGKQGFAAGFYNYLVANPTATKEQATAYIMGTDGNAETSANTQKHLSHYLGIHDLVVRVYANATGVAAE